MKTDTTDIESRSRALLEGKINTSPDYLILIPCTFVIPARF